MFQIKNTLGYRQLTSDNVICNYTTLFPIIESYKDNLVLLGGIHYDSSIIDSWGLKNYVTFDEYAALFPYLVPISRRKKEDQEKMKQIVHKRIPYLKDSDFNQPFPVSAIFLLGDCVRWEGKTKKLRTFVLNQALYNIFLIKKNKF